MNEPIPQRPSWPSLGVALVAFGGCVLFLGRDIAGLGLGHNEDPGPKAFPAALALFLIAGGLVEIFRWFRQDRNGTRQEKPSPLAAPLETATSEPEPARPPWRRAMLLLGLMLVYLAAIGWTGFSLSTLALGALMMMTLGIRLRPAVLSSLLLVLIVKGVFGWALRVPLPEGRWGVPF